jgi:hypothetical protein
MENHFTESTENHFTLKKPFSSQGVILFENPLHGALPNAPLDPPVFKNLTSFIVLWVIRNWQKLGSTAF